MYKLKFFSRSFNEMVWLFKKIWRKYPGSCFKCRGMILTHSLLYLSACSLLLDGVVFVVNFIHNEFYSWCINRSVCPLIIKPVDVMWCIRVLVCLILSLAKGGIMHLGNALYQARHQQIMDPWNLFVQNLTMQINHTWCRMVLCRAESFRIAKSVGPC